MTSFKSFVQEIRLKALVPYLAALAVFLILSITYVSPVLHGQRLQQPDVVKWQGMSKEIADFREQTGEEALWTNSMFGGMPAYQISVWWANNIARPIHKILTLGLPQPADMIFLYFLGFFVFLLLLQVNPWIALAGSVAFTFSSYHFIILQAGHITKAIAIAYMAPVLGSIMYTFRGHLWKGGILFAIFMSLQLFANHFQITYYLGIIVAFYGLFQLIEHIQQKKAKAMLPKLGVLFAGLIVAIGINIGNFWGTYAYTSETMRGGTELSIREEPLSSGLSKDYITNWSYGIGETISLFIPNAKGGASGQLGANRKAMEQVNPEYERFLVDENHYWGEQPFTSGPVYVGAVVLFFFFLALFYVSGPLKWGLAGAIVLSILLSWGRNFMPLTDFFIDYVPGYNKFRAVSMTLVIAELCIPALAFLGLWKFFERPEELTIKSKAFLTALGATAGLAFILYMSPRLFLSFVSQEEAYAYAGMVSQNPAMSGPIQDMLHNLEIARVFIFKSDALRSFLFATAAGVLTLLFARGILKKPVFLLVLVLLITADMWPVNKRYLNNDHFIPKRRTERPFPMRAADQHILRDNDQFRVLDVTESTFNSSRASYYHHSIGGYHGAKLQRYQDLIDFHLADEITAVLNKLRESESLADITRELQNQSVLNMLNTRYVIYHPEAVPIMNPYAIGNARFITDYQIVDHADEEILALGSIDPSREAVIDRRHASHVEGRSFTHDPTASISLVNYQPNQLVYDYKAESEQLVVFSEIHYPDGWEVDIDGEKAVHFRANYVLRAMVVPAGEHTITFSFRPAPYYKGRYVSLAFSGILLLAFLSVLFMHLKKAKDQKEAQT
jgi:hypothetical protein